MTTTLIAPAGAKKPGERDYRYRAGAPTGGDRDQDVYRRGECKHLDWSCHNNISSLWHAELI